ncbi:MAG: phosphate/phosphite/phosphonate ABC transporter substrate-binding protein [Candidatus Methylomirabilia bacterium]
MRFTERRSSPGRRIGRVLLAAAALVVALACGREPPKEKPAPAAALPSSGPPITIALLPERNVFAQKKRYKPLQEYLSTALNQPVVFKLLDNYQVIFTEILEHRVEGAFFGSMNGAIAQLKGGVEILARPVELSGVSTYHGKIFTKLDSGITRDPKTWKGKRIALVNKVTTAGYLYPLSLLRLSGFKGEPETYFKQMIFTGSHDAAILAVFNGESDFGACKNTVYEEYTKLHPEIQRNLTVLASSSVVPSNGLGVRPDLDPELKRRLREALLTMNTGEDGQRALRQFQAQSFVATGADDYEPVFSMAKQAGLDLRAWPLREIH